MNEELKVKVRLDTSELKNGIKEIKDALKNTSAEFGGINKATQGAANSTKVVTTAMATMGATTVAQTAIMAKAMSNVAKSTKKQLAPMRSYLKLLKDDFKGLFSALTKNFDAAGDNKIKAWLGTLKTGLKEVGVTSKDVGKKIKQHLSEAFASAKNSIKNSMDSIKKFILKGVAAISALMFALLHISSSTREYRQAMNQLNTSFIALGSNAETAGVAYGAFYRILGDVQRSTEAANLLAQITTEEKNLVTWTKIATGAMAMFPDSLPTESLIEATNETIKTAKVTGVLADALNWPAGAANKISKALKGSTEAQSIFNNSISQGMTVEDAFNEVLKETNSETQREVILRASLNGIYAQSAGLYEEMNNELIKQNEAQNRLNQVMAKLGSITQPVQTAFTNFKATLAEALAPAIKVLCDWLVKLIRWLTTAAAYLGAFIAVIFPSTAEKISNAFNGVSSSIKDATGGTGGLNQGLEESEKTAQKLRKTLMGFDELNVVSKDSGSGSGSSAGSGGTGTGNGIDVSGLDTDDSIFKTAQEQMEEFKGKAEEIVEKIKGFIEEFKTEIAIIGAALAVLGIANLLGNLGEAIGLGDKFLGVMGTIKKLALSAITIVLQYSLVNEFMDNFIDGEGFKEYIKGLLVAAIGTGILYAMWGSTGLIIGLGVTAVASIKALLDAEDVTNIEGAVAGLTGLASAVGAVFIAWKSFGPMGATITLVVEAVTALVMGVQDLINKGPTLQNTILIIGGAVAAAVAAATGGLSLVVSAVIGVTAAAGAFTAAILLEKPAILSVEEAQRALTDAKKAAEDAEMNYINAVDAAEASMNRLEEVEKRTGLSGKELFEQVQQGTLDYADMTDAQKEVYKAYLDNEKKQRDLKKSTEELAKAKKAETLASFEHQLALAKESGSYEDFKQSVVDAYKSGALSADEARTLIEKSMSEMSDASQQTFMEDIPSDIQNGLDPHKYEATRTKISKWFKNLWEDIKNIFSDVGEWASGILTDAWNSITNYWNKHIAPIFTKKYWSDKFSAIKDGAKSAFNGVMDVVERAVNRIIDKINTLSWKIPNWVPGIGGDTFGFNFRRISIPRLADGGIVMSSTLANIGERGKEAVLPLDRNTQWMDQLADRIAARSQVPTRLVLKVGERELGWATINGINQITKQTGELQLVL